MLSKFHVLVSLLSMALTAAAARDFHNAAHAGWSHPCVGVEENRDGAPALIFECHDSGPNLGRQWDVAFSTGQNVGPQQIKAYGDKCLQVERNENTDGARVQIGVCSPNNPNQQWTAEKVYDKKISSRFRWGTTDKCLDVKDHDVYPFVPLVISVCSNYHLSQNWADRHPNPDEV
ncbi:hypothetical protein MIND_00973900 [Mycena indigotica]|uniref:Ricin B lectin domain-containing protein n=1 Tax=Mycena indigotica TaxID=2126181 RepID=A0A8H6SDE2_9AGAR|nr:uncharacterized protein MIND_00973900 [Mycena indigotica]KAF7297403.1 hypothetical protein MIND_00973900 [Mycena indigotica]